MDERTSLALAAISAVTMWCEADMADHYLAVTIADGGNVCKLCNADTVHGRSGTRQIRRYAKS
jgi:hypothetical protein